MSVIHIMYSVKCWQCKPQANCSEDYVHWQKTLMIWSCPANKETLLTENVSNQNDPPLLVPLYDVQYNSVHQLTYVSVHVSLTSRYYYIYIITALITFVIS